MSDDWVVFGGVDTHRDVHVAAVVDTTGRLLGSAPFAADTAGYEQMGDWLVSHGSVALVGIEGTGSYGAGLARHLSSVGVEMVEVNRPNSQLRRRFGKTDATDAEAAARAALSGQATGSPKSGDGPVEAIRMLQMPDRSRSGDPVARLAIPCVRHQHRTVSRGSGSFSPGPCSGGGGHPGHQSPWGSLALSLGQFLRQRSLASLRNSGSQPLPVDSSPHPTGREVDQREHRPHPSLQTARKDREPQRETDSAPTGQMAMGRRLSHRPRQPPQPSPTLLNPPKSSPQSIQTFPPDGLRASCHALNATTPPARPSEATQYPEKPRRTASRHHR